jgi:RNA polymerase sigma-70 factor (ECF subfamily)
MREPSRSAHPPPARLDDAADTATDLELVERVLAGQREQYAVLVRRYQEGLFRHALGMVRDADLAADLVQDAFVRAYSSLKRCRDRSKFGGWLFQILRNRCLDHLKERRRSDLRLDDRHDLLAGEGGPGVDLERLSLRDLLDRSLARLPEAQREAFLLKHVQDLTYEEMSEVTDASVSALRMRVLRAREMLRTLLEEELGALGRRP